MGLDKVLFIPSYISPHKQNGNPAGPDDRKAMIKLAVENEPDFEIEDYEIDKRGVSYSIDTVRYLKNKYKDDKLYWIIGADMLFNIEKWHEYRQLLNEMEFISVVRNGFDADKCSAYIDDLCKKYAARIILCRMKRIGISSSMIRDMVKRGKCIKKFVHKKVGKYIIDNNLYK